MTWAQGRTRVNELLAASELALVGPAPRLAGRLMDEATTHLASARSIAEADSTGAYQLAYDAARKACSALLAVQGLRATTRGGHVAVQDAAVAQFNGPKGHAAFRSFRRLRRSRATKEYPDLDTPTTSGDDINDALGSSEAIVAACRQLLESGRIDPFVP